jgi:hypothetical protein
LQANHPAVLAEGDVSNIRVWSFQQLRVIVGTAEVTLNAEREVPPKQGESTPTHAHPEESEAHNKGKKGR